MSNWRGCATRLLASAGTEPDGTSDDEVALTAAGQVWVISIGDNGGYFTPVIGDGAATEGIIRTPGMSFGAQASADRVEATAAFLARLPCCKLRPDMRSSPDGWRRKRATTTWPGG